jgi:putative ABC transport system permease protein
MDGTVDSLLRDIRFAVRSLRKTPAFSAIVILTLALGIGANAAIFTAAETLVFRPFPFRDPEQIVSVREEEPQRTFGRHNVVAYPNFADWRSANRSFSAMAAYGGFAANLSGSDQPEFVRGEEQSAELFSLLGIAPAFGRDFRPDEDRPGAARTVILSHDLWRQRFGADSAWLGRPIQLNGVPHVVIGVMPKGFGFPSNAQLWRTLQLDDRGDRGDQFLEVVARLRPSMSIARARADVGAIAAEVAERFPATNKGHTVSIVPQREHEAGRYYSSVTLLLTAVALVLLIACANVAGLTLTRAAARKREIALRSALGASRTRIVSQLLTESVILALVGGGMGVLVAVWSGALMERVAPADRPFWMQFGLDWRVLLFTLAVAVASGVLCGLSPVLQAVRTDLNDVLRDGGRGSSGGVRRQQLRKLLVVGELAMSLMLLVGAMLMIRSVQRMQAVDLGFGRTNVLTVSMRVSGSAYDSASHRVLFLQSALERLRALPGVQIVGATNILPLSGQDNRSSFTVDGETAEGSELPSSSWRSVSGDYFRSLGIQVVRGRAITDADLTDKSYVAVINATMARRSWPGRDAIGQRFRFGRDPKNPWFTVVGVAHDVMADARAEPQTQFFIPYSLRPFGDLSFALRSSGDAASLTASVREALKSVDPVLATFGIQTMEERYRQSLWEARLYGWMFALFATVALALAVLGVYGVVSFMVGLRTQEIGLRMALGAPPNDVLRMVLRSTAVIMSRGLALGLIGAVVLVAAMSGILYGVNSADYVLFATMPLLLATVALVATYIPARRAARVDPLVALRHE